MRETWSLIFDNVRFGEILFPDMQTIVRRASTSASGCCIETRRALRRRGRCAARCDYVCDATAERIAEALAELPDGRWEG